MWISIYSSITTFALDSKYFKYTVWEKGLKRSVQDSGVNNNKDSWQIEAAASPVGP